MARGRDVRHCSVCGRSGHDRSLHRRNPDFFSAGGKVHPIRGSKGYSESVRARIDRQKKKPAVATHKVKRQSEKGLRVQLVDQGKYKGYEFNAYATTPNKFGLMDDRAIFTRQITPHYSRNGILPGADPKGLAEARQELREFAARRGYTRIEGLD